MINIFEKLLGSLKLKLNMFNKKQSSYNSPNSIQVQGSGNVVNQQTETIPEIEVWLPGAGAKETFEGYIKNHSNNSIILEYVEINNVKTNFNQELRNLIYIRDRQIQYPPEIFREKQDIVLKTRYHTLQETIYEFEQKGEQTTGPPGKFNISFNVM